MSRELRATFASVFALFFLTIIVIVGSIDMRSPIPILVEALLVGGTVTLALRSRSAKHRASAAQQSGAGEPNREHSAKKTSNT